MMDVPEYLRESVLVLRCQAGDDDAFEEIVAAYSPRLRYFLLKLLGGREAVEDVAQEVWLDVYRGLKRLRRPDSFRAWLYRIARDRAARVLRRTRPRAAHLDDGRLVSSEPETEEFTAEDAAAIHAALDRLSTEHREVLLLRFIEDLSYDEIAKVTGSQVGTVKSRIHHAKRLLRKQIEGMSFHG
jgi:RNA polymerase sigma-70 factor (ECF subfamily)